VRAGLWHVIGVVAVLARLPAMAAGERVREWLSPDRQVRISSVKIGSENEIGYQLRLSKAGHTSVIVDQYFRAVDVSWSPGSKYVAVTDWMGSNVSDCYIVDTDHPEGRFSMTEALPKLPEEADSHFYVSYQGWESVETIRVRASGHTDYTPVHEFDYRFLYDVVDRRVTRL